MADAGFYRVNKYALFSIKVLFKGTSFDQDSRFTDKQRKLLKQMRFEKSLETKVGVVALFCDCQTKYI